MFNLGFKYASGPGGCCLRSYLFNINLPKKIAGIILIFSTLQSAMAIDFAALWNFSKPEVSEQNFRAALKTAAGDDAFILQTQIARTYGLRKDFAKAQSILLALDAKTPGLGAQAQARLALELGRTYASAAHAPESQSKEAKAIARVHYEKALQISRAGNLDALAIDAIHMLAFVDTALDDQLKWAREALAVVEASNQPDAKRWEASIRNNIGYALHQLGRYDMALAEFNRALAIREQGTNATQIRTAKWMVAWTLRSLKRDDEAIAMQLGLEREGDADGSPDTYVFEELETLYKGKGNLERAQHYAGRLKTSRDASK